MGCKFFNLLFLLAIITTAVSAQSLKFEEMKGSWFTSGGDNELVLLVADDFALFENQFWDMDSTETGELVLKHSGDVTKIFILKDGETYFLDKGTNKIPVWPRKTTDLKTRKVGTTDVSKDFFKSDQVLLQGVFIPKESLPSTVTVIYSNAFGEGQRQFSGDVDEKGRFKVIFPLDYPQLVMVQIGNAFFTYFTSPGAKQAMIVDEISFSQGVASWTEVKSLDFMGDLAVENEERRLLDPEFMKIREYFLTDSMQKTLDSEEFMHYRLDLMKKHEAFFRNYFDSIPVSSLLQDISLRGTRTYTANDLRRYIWLHQRITDGRLTPIDVSDEYIQGVKRLISNDLEDLMTSEYASLMREFTMPIQPSEMKSLSSQISKLTYDFLKKQNLSESQRSSVEDWYDQIKREIPRDSLVLSEEYKELTKTYQSGLANFFPLAQWGNLQQKITHLGSIPRSSIIAIFLDMNFHSKGAEIPESIQNQFESLSLEPQVLAKIKEDLADFERSKNERFVEGVAITENSENVLAQLKAKFPGKVIYIDVWATWCGPCIGEFKYAKAVKKEAPEDVVFAYICAQSEREAFENQVKKFGLVGEHFFLGQSEYQNFDKEFNITGFPTYMILTKEGKLVKEGIHRPSSGPTLVDQLKEFTTR